LSSLLGISKRAPLGVAYCLTKPELAIVQQQPWPVHRSASGFNWQLFSASPTGLLFSARPPGLTVLQHQPGDLVTSICFGSHVSSADTLTLLIKASAMVTVNRGHCGTLLPAWD